jgi:hypothetical protein
MRLQLNCSKGRMAPCPAGFVYKYVAAAMASVEQVSSSEGYACQPQPETDFATGVIRQTVPEGFHCSE